MDNIFFYILSLKINGIKNINKQVEFDFYNAKITNDFDTSMYNIKAIYGENGVGKSGIISSLLITKKIVQRNEYLKQTINQEFLINTINKEKKKFEIEIEFLIKIAGNIFIYNYILNLAINKGRVIVSKEEIKERLKTKKSYKTLLNVENGIIHQINCDDSLKEIIVSSTNNILLDGSIVGIVSNNGLLINSINDYNDNDNSKFLSAIFSVNLLFDYMTIYMDQSDTHEDYIIRNFISSNRKMLESIGEKALNPLITIFLSKNDYDINKINVDENLVKKNNIKIFEKNIKKLTNFIQIFKPDLKNIEIERKTNGDNYICRLIMKYNKYDINTEYESNGVKKLINMFNALLSLNDGNIVFIDEIDSNIHDVYLFKLIQYFDRFSKGQLCFTTHNLSPMTLLSKRKKGIDFISREGDVVSWTSNGNRSAINFYQNGMVDKCPFNLQYFDFLKVFEEE